MRRSLKELVAMGAGVVSLGVAVYFYLIAVGLMASGLVATSLLSALIGFTLTAASLQFVRIAIVARSLEDEGR